MPSSNSQLSIANAALVELGSTKRLTSVSLASADQESRDIAALWDQLRDDALAAHPWNFAIRRAPLNLASPEPESDWDYRYQLPPECLQWLPPRRGIDSWFDGTQEGNYILTNMGDGITVRYIHRITAVAEWAPRFVRYMTLLVAAAIAEAVSQDESVKQGMEDKAEAHLRKAKRTDGLATGQRKRHAQIVRSDILSARRRRGTSFVQR